MADETPREKAGYSILVVDDSPVMRMFIRRVLAVSGVPTSEVREADNGVTALEVLRSVPVDLVLSDINMPEMNGSELMERISENPELRRIPVIVVSTDSSLLRVKMMLHLGARGYIQKPFPPEALRSEIERVLEL
jgi:two-component system chemotaxis response regulator CheY